MQRLCGGIESEDAETDYFSNESIDMEDEADDASDGWKMVVSLLLDLVLKKVHKPPEYIHLTENHVQKLSYTYY